ncbi:MAG: hypothetical protein EA381_01140 [Planctomycetaceae bacterium]|nr:MAG: hypothetical protein EA381_01140 [Planctomycetaceae bacterium]
MSRGGRTKTLWDTPSPDDDYDYDDSSGYGWDPGSEEDEDDEYRDFLQREFGVPNDRPQPTKWLKITAIVVLIAFILPTLLLVLQSLGR